MRLQSYLQSHLAIQHKAQCQKNDGDSAFLPPRNAQTV